MISILFVDDEANILEGIRNSLRKRLAEWDLGFAQSGMEALEILSKKPYDIIISDMRMPGMDGASLLAKIQDKYPHMTRFILTGQADREAIMRAIPVTHQFIYKPCSPVDLLALLDRTCCLHDRIQNEDIRKLVSSAKCVPSAPKTAQRIAEIAASENGSLREIAEIVEKDPGLAARIIQVSNSAAMGRAKEITRVSDAVSCIGVECTQALAIANEVFHPQQGNSQLNKVVEKTYESSFAGAKLAGQFLMGNTDCGLAMTATLLRDIGLIVTAGSNLPVFKAYVDSDSSVEELLDTELRKFGVTHADIGGHLLALWGIPLTIVEAVTYHHNLEESSINPFLMASVHVADIAVSNPQADFDELLSLLNWEYIELHNLESEVEDWLKMSREELDSAA